MLVEQTCEHTEMYPVDIGMVYYWASTVGRAGVFSKSDAEFFYASDTVF